MVNMKAERRSMARSPNLVQSLDRVPTSQDPVRLTRFYRTFRGAIPRTPLNLDASFVRTLGAQQAAHNRWHYALPIVPGRASFVIGLTGYLTLKLERYEK